MSEIGFPASPLSRRPPGERRNSARQPADSVATLSPAEATASIDGWRDLATRSAEANVFFHPGFLLPAIDHLDPTVTVATVRCGNGDLVALAPVVSARLGKIAPATRIWVHDYGPLGSPLVDPSMLDTGADGLIRCAGAGSLVIPDLPLQGPVVAALIEAASRADRPCEIVDEHARAVLNRRGDGPADSRAALPTGRRKELARQMRRLGDLGAVTIETATNHDRVRARFEEFLVLEMDSWKGEAGTALASRAATAAFAREVVFNRSERGTVRIVSIRLGDKPVAIVVCFVAGATAYTWKIAHDARFARYSPGAQLMLEAGDSLLADPAIASVDSCASANHPMIDALWRDRIGLGTLVVGPVGGGALYRIGLAACRGEIAARATAKTLRARLKQTHGARRP
ncbi:MAG: GNAT family N-acetyltransferase [Bauldia litoralis]